VAVSLVFTHGQFSADQGQIWHVASLCSLDGQEQKKTDRKTSPITSASANTSIVSHEKIDTVKKNGNIRQPICDRQGDSFQNVVSM